MVELWAAAWDRDGRIGTGPTKWCACITLHAAEEIPDFCLRYRPAPSAFSVAEGKRRRGRVGSGFGSGQVIARACPRQKSSCIDLKFSSGLTGASDPGSSQDTACLHIVTAESMTIAVSCRDREVGVGFGPLAPRSQEVFVLPRRRVGHAVP